MKRASVVIALAVAACASPPSAPVARVTDVILYRDTVNMLMSDGSLCVLDRPARATRYQGMTTGCPRALSVSVNTLPVGPRQVLAPGGDAVVVNGAGWG